MKRGIEKFPFRTIRHEADFCVIGGGMAGLCAALAAARRGARVVLMQDRPMLGGNASSECRMHVCGADRSGRIPHMRETGILEEIRLDNLFENPHRSFSVWDLLLLRKVQEEPRITLLLNCTCQDAEMDNHRIRSITGWQLTTQTRHTVHATLFADCSGDSVLAPLTGAPWRMGREARAEFGESIAPEQADTRTMGMTCLFQARPHPTPQPFTPPPGTPRFERCDELPYGASGHGYWEYGYWWIELGGEQDALHDTESLRIELHKLVLGIWDHIKNSGAHPESAHWALEWVQMLPAKRESRRYEGDHLLTQHDIEAGGRFPDVVAYGGWSMDDHDPAGFRACALGRKATIFHPAPSPYGIPYRCLYSRTIENLYFAGRNASCTHAAMSSTRVMGTCAVMGQAVGTAAALAVRRRLTPREVGTSSMPELQQMLLEDDCYLPGVPRRYARLSHESTLLASGGNPEPVRDGFSRQIGNDPHAWIAKPGDWIEYRLPGRSFVREVELVLDTGMEKQIGMIFEKGGLAHYHIPPAMPKAFRVEGLVGRDRHLLHHTDDNRQRHHRVKVGRELDAVRFVLEDTRGAPESRVYVFAIS